MRLSWEVVMGKAIFLALLLIHAAPVGASDQGVATVGVPQLSITAPLFGDDWEIGSSQSVTWSTNGIDLREAEVELSRDGGVTWQPITGQGRLGMGRWTWSRVTPPFSCECRIRVNATGSEVDSFRLTSGEFHIVPRDMAHEARRTFEFAGQTWGVRAASGNATEDPGGNYWADDYENAWVEDGDGQEELHLKITNEGDRWHCAEVFTLEPTGYGTHRFYLVSRVDLLDPFVVAALFLYKNDCNEVDIEFSTWGLGSGSDNLQYAVQPGKPEGNINSTFMELTGSYTTHCIDWQPDAIRFMSIHGHLPEPPNTCYCIPNPANGFCLSDTDQCGWIYRGPDIPAGEKGLRVHINLWLLDAEGDNAPLNGREAEIVIRHVELPHPD
jgi:hypothetical protein